MSIKSVPHTVYSGKHWTKVEGSKTWGEIKTNLSLDAQYVIEHDAKAP